MRRILAVGGLALLGVAITSAPATAGSFNPSPVQHVTVNGASFGYRTVGEGPPLVMIIGFANTMAEWDPVLVQRLAAEHQVILFDNRGMGESADASVEGLTIDSMADDAAALIETLTPDGKADVLGWSMGSYIAQEVALRHPSQVRRLVLAASDPGTPKATQPKPAVVKILTDPNTTPAEFNAILFPRAAQQSGTNYINRLSTWPGIDADSFLTPPATIEAQTRAGGPLWYGRGHGTHKELPELDKPTFVADGRLDVIVPDPNSKLLARRIPDATLKLFRHAGHAFLFQLNHHFSRHVNAFLG